MVKSIVELECSKSEQKQGVDDDVGHCFFLFWICKMICLARANSYINILKYCWVIGYKLNFPDLFRATKWIGPDFGESDTIQGRTLSRKRDNRNATIRRGFPGRLPIEERLPAPGVMLAKKEAGSFRNPLR